MIAALRSDRDLKALWPLEDFQLDTTFPLDPFPSGPVAMPLAPESAVIPVENSVT